MVSQTMGWIRDKKVGLDLKNPHMADSFTSRPTRRSVNTRSGYLGITQCCFLTMTMTITITCSAQLSMFHMERRSRNTLTIIIIAI